MLEVESVTCYYGAMRILKEVSLSAKKGEFFGIIGPNGSGKTTLLRCISRVIKPKEGRVVMGEEDISSLGKKELAKDLAVVSQHPKADLTFTALEVVIMGRVPHLGRFQSESRRDLDIATWAMKQTKSLQLADRPINELSGGEKQRVFIARALAQEPKLLLLDEPTANLDINYQLEIMNLIKEMSEKERLTVIVAIHDLNLAAQYCDRMALLSHGEIVSLGSPEDVLTPENIRKAFNVNVIVKRHEMTSSIYVTPIQVKEKPKKRSGIRVHLICGAGTGSSLMNLLTKWGYEVTAGVLNVLDTDHETAQSLGVTVVSEAPFSPITENAHAANLHLVENADLVLLTTPPFGPGNLLNLEAAKFALDKNIPFAIFKKEPTIKHEYEFKEAESLLSDLKRAGVRVIARTEELMKIIEDLKNDRKHRP
jgi:iron complex transport system ATP-binding protein